MTLPPLQNWEATRNGLHRAALIINQAQRALDPAPKPYSLQYSLDVGGTGLGTHPLHMARIGLDLINQTVRVAFTSGGGLTIALVGTNPKALAESLMTAFEGEGMRFDITSDDTDPFVIDAGLAAEYGVVLDAMYTVLARVRAKTIGYWSPLVLWAHHFDLSQLWFPLDGLHDEHTDPHINIGFSPGDDTITRPYVYLYGWSQGGGYVSTGDLPAPASWNPTGYTGARIDYDALRDRPDAVQAFSETILGCYRVLVEELA